MLPMVLKVADKVKIDGESSLKGFEKQIDVEHLVHEINMPMVSDKSSNSRTSGRCKHGEFVCSVRMNKSYPKLLEACAKGSNLGKVELSMVKINEGAVSVVAKFVLTDVYISEVRLAPEVGVDAGFTAETGNTTLPWVEFALNYQTIAVTYNEFDKTGANKGAVSCDPISGLGA